MVQKRIALVPCHKLPNGNDVCKCPKDIIQERKMCPAQMQTKHIHTQSVSVVEYRETAPEQLFSESLFIQ